MYTHIDLLFDQENWVQKQSKRPQDNKSKWEYHGEKNMLVQHDIQDYSQFISATKVYNMLGLHKLTLIQSTQCRNPSKFYLYCAPPEMTFSKVLKS